MLLPDAEHVAAVMEGYLPLVKPTPKGKELVRASQAEGRASQRSQDVAAQQSQEGAQLTSQPEDVDSEESEWLAELEGSGAALMIYADDITVPTRRGHLSVSRQEGSTDVRWTPDEHHQQILGTLLVPRGQGGAARPLEVRTDAGSGPAMRVISDFEGNEQLRRVLRPAGGMDQLVEGFRTLARSRDRTPPRSQEQKSAVDVD